MRLVCANVGACVLACVCVCAYMACVYATERGCLRGDAKFLKQKNTGCINIQSIIILLIIFLGFIKSKPC